MKMNRWFFLMAFVLNLVVSAAKADSWKCPKCSTENIDNYCSECGTKYPGWECQDCGTLSIGRYCSFCASERPDSVSNGVVNAGQVITFGNYYFQNDQTKVPVQWLVLDTDQANNKALVTSKYILDGKSFHSSSDRITWEKCALHKWLNNSFLKTVFDEEEQSAVLVTHVENSKVQGEGVEGGNDTEDRIFLLSLYESKTYFKDDKARMCAVSPYAESKGVITYSEKVNGEAAGKWWLRSQWTTGISGNGKYSTKIVRADGTLVDELANGEVCGVRPAFWLDLNKVRVSKDGAVFMQDQSNEPWEADVPQTVGDAIAEEKEEQARVYQVGDTVSTDMVELVLNRTRFTETLDTRTFSLDGNGYSAGEGKMFLWFGFTWKNLSSEKQNILHFDTSMNYQERYHYELGGYSDANYDIHYVPHASDSRALSVEPLSSQQVNGYIIIPNEVRYHKDQIKIIFSLPSTNGSKTFVFQLTYSDDALPVNAENSALFEDVQNLISVTYLKKVKSGNKIDPPEICTKWDKEIDIEQYKDSYPALYQKLSEIKKNAEKICTNMKKKLTKKTAKAIQEEAQAILDSLNEMNQSEFANFF